MTDEHADFAFEPPGMLEIHVKHASEVDDALTKAIDVVQKAAIEHRTGILVTRIDAGSYTVRAYPAVSFGLVRQEYETASRATPGMRLL